MPPPHIGGVQTAMIPAPPKDGAEMMLPETVATTGLLLKIVTGAEFCENPFSSVKSASTVSVCPWVILAEVVRFPGVSPGRCSRISMGMQARKFTADEDTLVLVAKTPVNPGAWAVSTPLVSIVATGLLVLCQVIGPTRAVMSVPL